MNTSSGNLMFLRDSSWIGCLAFLSFAMILNRQKSHMHVGNSLFNSSNSLVFS
jgi:hypothetical protein